MFNYITGVFYNEEGFTFSTMAVLFMALMPFTNAIAQIPRLINYQASLLDQANQPVNGALSVTFAIYDNVSGGSPPGLKHKT